MLVVLVELEQIVTLALIGLALLMVIQLFVNLGSHSHSYCWNVLLHVEHALFEFCHVLHNFFSKLSFICSVSHLHPGVLPNLLEGRSLLMVISHHVEHHTFKFLGVSIVFTW